MTRARRIEGTPTGPGSFAVPSRSDPSHEWIVEWRSAGTHFCYCPGFTQHGRCRHTAAVFAAVADEWSARKAREAAERLASTGGTTR